MQRQIVALEILIMIKLIKKVKPQTTDVKITIFKMNFLKFKIDE